MALPSDEQSQVVLLVTARLESADVPYMISGSIALSVYAQPRMTRDLDIIVDVPGDPARLARVFEEGFYVDSTAVARAVRERRMFNAIHLQSLFKVDVVIRKDSAYRCEEFQRRRRVRFANVSIWVVAPEDLLLSKLEWWHESRSALQWTDLLALSHVEMDWEYVERWAHVMGLSEHLASLRR